MWIFGLSLGVCSMELRNLVSSLENLVSNERQVLLEGMRLGGSTIEEDRGGWETVGTQSKLALCLLGGTRLTRPERPHPAIADDTRLRSAWPAHHSAINGMAMVVRPRACSV